MRRKKKKKTGARQNFPQHRERRSRESLQTPHPWPRGASRCFIQVIAMPGCLAHGLDPGEGSSIVSNLPIRAALFPFFDTREACSLRGVCHELKQAVTDFPWEDMSTVIRGSFALWRACFPRARGANAGQRSPSGATNSNGRLTPVVDGDFVHFVGLRALNMTGSWQVTRAGRSQMQPLCTSGALRG